MGDSRDLGTELGEVVHVSPARPDARVIVVCEHASNRIPAALNGLGLAPGVAESHIAWDPGALPVAQALAGRLAAPLVHGGISRLVYDCNRPPEAVDAIPAVSEIHAVPGNQGLSDSARQKRIAEVYEPFRASLAGEIARYPGLSLLVTVHSFTPVYRGERRAVELGLLHGTDPRFAAAMADAPPAGWHFDTRVNEPYGPADGVTHTLDLHGAPNGLLSVMLEIRNDLIAAETDQAAMAAALGDWIARVHHQTEARGAA